MNACVACDCSVMQAMPISTLGGVSGRRSFDVKYPELQTIQAERSQRLEVLKASQLLRIGKRAVISLPNFGHWRIRLSLLLNGRMPRTSALDYSWHDTPNIHLCTISDFVAMARGSDVEIERAADHTGEGLRTHPSRRMRMPGAQTLRRRRDIPAASEIAGLLLAASSQRLLIVFDAAIVRVGGLGSSGRWRLLSVLRGFQVRRTC